MLLYKYRMGKYATMFKTMELIFSPPSLFSDPFECRPVAKTDDDETVLVKKTIARFMPILQRDMQDAIAAKGPAPLGPIMETCIDKYFGSKKPLDALMLRHFIGEDIANANDTQIGILSLSATGSSPLMWAQYADEHRGFAVGFDSSDDFFKPSAPGFGQPMKVQYSTERPTWTWADLTEYNRFLTKSVDFLYEQEWRVLRACYEITA